MHLIRRRDEAGLTVVEVLIAALLLTAIISGIALSMSGATKLQTSSKVSVALNAAAQRAFEAVRSDRSWMQNCTTLNQECGIDGSVPAEVLEEKGLAGFCDGDAKFELQRAVAVPVDGQADGLVDDIANGGDRDGKVPDYHSITIVVALPGCAAARFPNVKPVTYVSAVDDRGDVPRGSLVVEICTTPHQSDDRMSISGCPDAGTSDVKMEPCVENYQREDGSSTNGCEKAWSWIKDLSETDGSTPTPFVRLERYASSFSLSGPESHSSGSAKSLGNGLYLFEDLPAGTYQVDGLAPPPGTTEWALKMIPSPITMGGTQTGASAIVQPDVRSRALIVFHQERTAELKFKFKRDVQYYNATEHELPLAYVGRDIPTEKWEGDGTAIWQAMAKANDLNAVACSTSEIVVKALHSSYVAAGIRNGSFSGAQCLGRIDNVSRDPNCIDLTARIDGMYTVKHAYTVEDEEGVTSTHYTYESFQYGTDSGTFRTCTVYDLQIGLKYYSGAEHGDPKRLDGAAIASSYHTAPAPHFRVTAPEGDVDNYTAERRTDPNRCLLPSFAPKLGGFKPWRPLICVEERKDPANGEYDLKEIPVGLNTGLTGKARAVKTKWGTQFVDDGGGKWDMTRNEKIIPIPDALKQGYTLADVEKENGIWVTPGGKVIGRDDKVYPDSLPATQLDGDRILVVGKGECIWINNGKPSPSHVGHCNPCKPWISALGGYLNGCFVLTESTHVRTFKYTGFKATGVFQFTPPLVGVFNDEAPVVQEQRQVCSSAPTRGNYLKVAPECAVVPSGGPGMIGGSGRGVRKKRVRTVGNGVVNNYGASVGSSSGAVFE